MYDILMIEFSVIYHSFDTLKLISNIVCGVVISDNNKRQLLARTDRIQMVVDELLAFTEKPIVESMFPVSYQSNDRQHTRIISVA